MSSSRFVAWFVGVALAATPVGAMTPEEAHEVVLEHMARADAIPAQADALADLAWPASGEQVDPGVREEARAMLIGFGEVGLPAIRRKIGTRREHSGDATLALIQAKSRIEVGLPLDYMPALEEAVWFGSREARIAAIQEMARYDYPVLILPMIDAAIEDPVLVPVVVDALGAVGDDRARFYLEGLLRGDDPALRERAARALASIRGRALDPLKSASRSDDRELREVAISALTDVAGPEELTALYEYVAGFPEDDPALIERVRTKAAKLEGLLDAYHSSQAASPQPDL